MTYTNLPAKASLKPTKFEVHVSDEQISKFKQLLSLSELGPKTYENSTDEKYFGVSYDWLANAKKYWGGDYDWRKTEAKINSYPNYTVDIDDDDGEKYKVHFIALYSDKKDAVPITFIHGWPGSFLEFLGLIDIVKSKYPSAANLPYHIIVPSQPGYAFSSAPSLKKNIQMQDVARVFDKLMVGLGFGNGYIAQGGDTGSFLSRMLAVDYPSCKAAHINMCMMNPPKDVPDSEITSAEKEALQGFHNFGRTGNAYAKEHGTRPATIGHVLSASPLAMLAWIGEKFLIWSDVDPTLDDILDSVSLYWFTGCYPTSLYHYRQFIAGDFSGDPRWRITAPKALGYSSFPKDIGSVPRAWAAKTGNLVWYKLHKDGGHFAAMEKPDLLLDDVADFVRQVWNGEAKL